MATTDLAGEPFELGEAPIVFTGEPPFMSGEIEFRNRSAEPAKLKRIALAGLTLRDPQLLPLEEAEIFATVAPARQQTLTARFQLDPHTLPGTYRGELVVGKTTRAFTIEVLEKRKVRLTPSTVRVQAGTGERQVKRISVTNLGNVAISLRDVTMTPLLERDALQRSLFASLKHGDEGYGKVLDAFVRELRSRLIEPEVIELKYERPILEPGESTHVSLTFHLPRELRARYFGTALFEDAELAIEVAPGAATPATYLPI